MEIWILSSKWWTIIEPGSKTGIVPIICYFSTNKGCPPDHDERGVSLMSVTLKLWKDMGNMLNVPLGRAPVLLELVEISLTLVNCRCFLCRQHVLDYESLEILLRKILIRIFFSINPFALLIKHIMPYVVMGKIIFIFSLAMALNL